jgi:hypothetical protein
LIRRFVFTFAAVMLIAPLLAWWSLRCVDSMFNTPHLWIPPAHEQRAEFEWFVEHFESQALVIISWPDCTIDDRRLVELEDALTDPLHELYDTRNADLIDRVITGYSIVRDLMDEPVDLSKKDAVARLRGVLVGKDGESSCAVVMFTDQGGYDRREAIEVILETAQAVCQLDRDAFRLAGPPVDGVAIDAAGIETMRRYALPSALVSLLFCSWCLWEWRYAVTIFIAAAFGEGLCLALVFQSGTAMNAILILMPPLVFVLTIAAGVHLVNYYFDEARSRGIVDAPRRALQVGWLPCALATATTAIGLGSLLVSDVEPIRTFGGFATIGVVATLLLLFLLLPGVMERWPIAVEIQAKQERPSNKFWLKLANLVIARATFICFASLAVIAALGLGLGSVQTSVKLRDLFSPRDRVLAEYAWLEENLGPMVPVEVVVHFPADSRLDFQQQILVVRAVANKVRELEDVDGVMSSATFAPRGRIRFIQQTIIRQRLVKARYLYEDEVQRSWRVTARVPALSDLDYEDFLQDLAGQVDPLVASIAEKANERIETTVTGVLPLIYQTQRTLLSDLLNSFVAAFGIVGVVMMIVLRSVRAGLLVMIPNIFPTAVIFGLMGWLRIPVDIGSVMTASIALGIAVVDTLHFLTWFRRDISAGQEAPEAVRRAYSHCATPMLQTSIICGIGMLVFVLSSFTPASRFAWMVFILLMAALVGDLVILPALLAGPLGKVFVSKNRSTE